MIAREGNQLIDRWAESRVIKRERRMIEIEKQKMIEIGKIFYLIFLYFRHHSNFILRFCSPLPGAQVASL